MSTRTKRPAFVTTLAIMLMALVAVALAAITARVATAARQSTTERERAQVEQLVVAGMDLSAGAPDGDRTIQLPPALEGASLRISVHGKRVEVIAKVGATTLRQITGE